MRRRYEKRFQHWDEKKEARAKVIEVFREMRKLGFLARADFLCCNTCARYSLTNRAEELREKGKEVKGAMFWHKQAEQGFWDDGRLFIVSGTLDSDKFGEIGLPTVEVGEILSEALKKEGIIVVWDGNPEEKILVKAYEEVKE